MNLSRKNGLVAAFALSFAVYLIPLFHLETGWLVLGKALSGVRDVGALSFAWILIALVLQSAAFIAVHWLLTRFSWRNVLLFGAASPLVVFGTNLILLWWLPLLLLVERDPAPEIGSLEKVCSIPNATIAHVRSGANLSMVRAGETWLVTGRGQLRSLLKMPGCQLSHLDGHFDGSTIDAVAPGGHVLHRQVGGAIAYLNPALNEFRRLSGPDGASYWKPVLSDDGMALAWLDRISSGSGNKVTRLNLRNLASGEERIVTIALQGPDQIELLGVHSWDGPHTLAQYRNAIFAIDRDGKVLRGPVSPDGIYDARWGFVWLNGGWVAWDGYRDDGRSNIVWNVPSGRGRLSIPLGRRIDSFSVSAEGDMIAVATSSNLRIGEIQSAVFAFRTETGEETYRRHYSVHSKSTVAFLGDEYLAVAEIEAGQASVVVYRMPATN